MSSPTLLKYEIERQLLVDLIPHTSYRVRPQTPTWASPLDPAKGLSPPDPHFCGVQKKSFNFTMPLGPVTRNYIANCDDTNAQTTLRYVFQFVRLC